MAEFTKYRSIENHYREKFVNDMMTYNPQYHTCMYIAEEKIDGGNFQFTFTRQSDGGIALSYGKRSSVLAPDENFYNYQSVVSKPEYVRFAERISEYMHEFEELESVVVYGEIFGRGVQNRINYGDIKKILFYDIMFNGEFMVPYAFYRFMEYMDALDLTVPVVGMFDSFEDAFNINVEGVRTLVNPDQTLDDNFFEGVVIKPYDTIAVNKDGEQVLFYVKKKSEKFKDQMKVKSKNTSRDVPFEALEAMNAFASYLTENRLMDVFGKHGTIQDKGQFGEYIKYMMEDAKEDFFKDCMDMFMSVPDKFKSTVFSVTGKIVSKMLFKYV